MIAFRDNLPLVEFRDGRVLGFERDWLARSVAESARRAGYRKWWLAEHVTESIINFLRNDFGESVVTEMRLREALESVLEVIGYPDVAESLALLTPPARLSLVDLAHKAGTGYELVFFQLLRESLRELLTAQPDRVELVELQSCVKTLRAAKIWRADCALLLDEIVRFVQTEFDTSGADQVALQLT